MASVGKSTSRINKRETRSPSDKKLLRSCEEISSSSSCVGEEDHSSALNGHDIQSLAITAQDLERLRVPKPPSDSQKPKSMTRVYVRRTRPPEEVSRAIRVTVARPLPLDVPPPHLFEYAGPGGPRFDVQGMVLPHSILGSLEDFRTEMQLRGETELEQRIPDRQKRPPLWVEDENEDNKAGVHSEMGRGHQSHALQHWGRHMTERRRQQDFISRFLQKPAGSLLMNRSSTFRRVQEQRDLISTALPALSAGHGHRVGSEFWSVPQTYGDEMSGITATLTQTERGKRPAVTRVAQPLSTRLESGNVACEAVSGGWDQSLYLQQRLRELKDVLRDFSPPEADGLEVVGSGLPGLPVSSRSPLPDEREDEDEEQKENQAPLALYEDVLMDVELRPALRVCGDLALWTGSTSSHQGQEGVSVRLMFETVTGQSVSADLELKNEGSTTIYYSWERLTQTHTLTQHFYFNNTTAVILPGSTKHISFIFKSASAGIMTEAWRLNTHPVLMGGASLRLTLRGVALEQDNSAQQRAALEELEQKASVSLCGRIVRDLLRGVHTPERPSSPADLYITDEELFNTLNPHLQYRREPVEALRGLWEQVNGSGDGPPWDLSLNTLRQALLSVSESDGESRETSLSHFNTLVLELQRPQIHSSPVTAQDVSVQLWRELLDGLVCESMRLRHSLGLQENNSWTDTSEQEEEERRGGALLLKGERRRASVRRLEETRAVQEGGSMRNHVSEERKTDSSFTTDPSHTLQDTYRALLHTQVYVLMERMMDSLCDLLDDTQHTPQTAY
ncbi:MYCBP-associated protein isoform X2 [Onychostoma macrolepis]|uniref:MYCBP-associated protein isoform X2 n=1 Tax=Onychostoma macrolepis TaxID=369639 RepID=UPI00272C655D|nr:MYCBP-associated protein isoform X2 [Onychostoma macrolepis]